MLSRLFITLTLVSSLSLTAAEFKQGYNTKGVTYLALATAAGAYVLGCINKSSEATSAAAGLLTGLVCAIGEDYAQTVLAGRGNNKLLPVIMPVSWIAERNLRLQTGYDAQNWARWATNRAFVADHDCARYGSWASYLAYHAARYEDNNSK